MDEGYTFVWPCGQLPYMIDENGLRIDLTVHDNIPYISLGTDECKPRKDHEASRIHLFLFDKNDDFNGEGTHRVFYIDSSSGDEVCDPNPESHKKKNRRHHHNLTTIVLGLTIAKMQPAKRLIKQQGQPNSGLEGDCPWKPHTIQPKLFET